MQKKIEQVILNKIKEKKTEKSKSNILTKILISFLIFIFLSLVWWIWFVIYLLKYLPTMEEIKSIHTQESTQILDRKWRPLYTIFWNENREIVPFEKITNNTIYAIISLEDEDFFNHWWVDPKWVFRAVLGQLWIINFHWWGSTITQQFVKNKFLTNERSYIRKLKEMILSMQIENTYSKEDIVTMYLNQIPFWSNIYWIEQASKTYFWKDSDKLNLVESVIVASIPNATTRFSPYWNHIRSRYILWEDWKNTKKISIWLLPNKIIKNIKIKEVKDWSWNIITPAWVSTWVVILWWRTSLALNKMLELKYISQKQFNDASKKLLNFKFKKNREEINAPHFVMYIKEKLEKEFWDSILKKWWLKVFTTLDLDLQKKAEELVKKNAEINLKKYDAENQALLTMNTKNWEILAMVGSKDYFDDEIDWQVNVLTQKRLAWSTFKPFAYTSMLLNWYSPYSIVFDVKTNFWEKWSDYEPQNFDWKFMWPLTLWKALWNSRNIPAIKAWLVWWIEKTYNIAKSMWIKFENAYDWYWASLPLWTVWVQWIDLLWAYMIFANNWEKIQPQSILKIIDQDWVILKKFDEKNIEKKQVLNPQIAYLMQTMLSNPDNRWIWWNYRMQLNWRINMAKTWTSNKSVEKKWYDKPIVMPLDWWTTWVTPQYSTIVWSWNNDWRTMNVRWSWRWASAKTWKDFMEFLHKWKPVENFQKPEWIKLIRIAKLSWLLPSKWTPKELIETWYFSDLNIPKKYDNSLKFVEIDKVSWKLPSNFTPEDAIIKAAVLNLHSLKPYEKRWEEPVQDWLKKYWKNFLKRYWIKEILATLPVETDNIHTRNNTLFWPKILISSPKDWWVVSKSWFSVIPEISSRNWNNTQIVKVDYYLNWKLNNSAFDYPFIWRIKLPKNIAISSKITLKVKAFDELYNSSEKTINLKIWEDNNPPYTEIVRPKNLQKLVAGSTFEVKTLTYDQWWQVENAVFYLDWKEIWKVSKAPFSKKIEIPRLTWEHKIKIIVIDTAWNSSFDEKVFSVIRVRNSSKWVKLILPKEIFTNKPFDYLISVQYSEIKNLEKISIFAKKKTLWWQEENKKIWEITDFSWNATWFFYLNWILNKWNYVIYLKKYLKNNEDWKKFSDDDLKEWKNILEWKKYWVEVK